MAKLPIREISGKWSFSKSSKKTAKSHEENDSLNELKGFTFSAGAIASDESELETDELEEEAVDWASVSSDSEGEPEKLTPSATLTDAENDKKELNSTENEFSSMSLDERRLYIGTKCSEVIEEAAEIGALLKLKRLQTIASFSLGQVVKVTRDGLSSSMAKAWQESVRLLLIGLLAVYQDISPGYSIRPLTELERSEKVSKDVMLQRDYEDALVSAYKAYIVLLVKLVVEQKKDAKQHKGSVTYSITTKYPTTLSLTACKCLLEILCSTSLNTFNFNDQVIRIVIWLAYTDKRPTFTTILQEYLERIYSEIDKTGQITSKLLKELADVIASNKYQRMPPCALSALLKIPTNHILPLTNVKKTIAKGHSRDDKKAGHKKLKLAPTHVSKKNKKLAKEESQWRKELEENEAILQVSNYQRWHQEILEHLFRIYIGFLKKSPRHLLSLPSFEYCLRGLALFGPYIQDSFLDDLILTLKGILLQFLDSRVQDCNDVRGFRTQLLCLQVLFLLSQQVTGVTFDMQPLYKHFYGILGSFMQSAYKISLDCHPGYHRYSSEKKGKKAKLSSKCILDVWSLKKESSDNEDTDQVIVLLIETFEVMFLRKNIYVSSVSLACVSAFLHRLTLLSLFAFRPQAILDAMLRPAFAKFPKLVNLLSTATNPDADDDEFVTGNGSFDLKVNDPESANALSFPLGSMIEVLAFNHPDENVIKSAKYLLSLYK